MKALIVEDDKAVRDLLRNILRKMGLEALEAECDDEVLKSLVYTEGIGLALLDFDSENIRCRDVCKEIKKHWPYVHLIVTSGDMAEPEEKALANIGVGAFLKKPFELADVREAMGQVLNHFNMPDYE